MSDGLWRDRRKMQRHFELAISQALIHNIPTEVILEGLVWAIHDTIAEPKIKLAEAWKALDL